MSRQARPQFVTSYRKNSLLSSETGAECDMGRQPVIVAYIKTGSKRETKEFAYQCDKLGIEARPVQSFGDAYCTAFELVGPATAIASIVGRSFVKDWHSAISARVGGSACGSGKEKKLPPHPAQELRTAHVAQLTKSDHCLAETRHDAVDNILLAKKDAAFAVIVQNME